MGGLAAVAMHRGGATAGSLGEREAQLRQLYNDQNKDAMASEIPIMPSDNRHPGKPVKVYRIPKISGWAYHYDIKPEVKTMQGEQISRATKKTIKFEPTGSGGYGQFVTADKDEQRLIETVLMKHPDYVHLGIVEFDVFHNSHLETVAAEDAKKLADPEYFQRVLRKMGVSEAEGFADLLKLPGKK